jgi:hypothetical protein
MALSSDARATQFRRGRVPRPPGFVVVEIGMRRIAIGFGVPAAFEPAVANEPMAGQRAGWNPAPARCCEMAKSRPVVVAMHVGVRPRRDAP